MPLILGTNSIKDTGFNVANSCRFNDGSSDSLTRTTETPTNADKFTFSAWVKMSAVGTDSTIISEYTDTNNRSEFGFISNGKLRWEFLLSGSVIASFETNRLFRDSSAWYHFVLAYDSTDGTAGDRFKIYINGVRETSFSSSTNPDQNHNSRWQTSGLTLNLGERGGGAQYFDGYMSEVVMIDGSALAPTSFGEFDSDSGIWKPIKISGLTFGDNGFYLEYKGSGTSANASGIGADTSGNTNHFTVNNLTALDQSTDTCTNNFATLNSAVLLTDVTLSEGNLKAAFGSASSRSPAGATLAPTSGKWYYELKLIASSTGNYIAAGYADIYANGTQLGNYTTAGSLGFGINAWDGTVVNRTSTTTASPGNFAITPDDILGVYLDIDNLQHTFTLNGTQHSTGYDAITASTTGFYIATIGDGGGSQTISAEINFGSPPFAISSGNTDANGYGNFEYSPTIGGVNFYALNSKNLAEFG